MLVLALEIYISGQVDTLNETFKLSYTSKVFWCGWRVIFRASANVVCSRKEEKM